MSRPSPLPAPVITAERFLCPLRVEVIIIDFVAVVNRLYRGNATQTSVQRRSERSSCGRFSRSPRRSSCHPRSSSRIARSAPGREYGSQLRPHIPAEGLRLNGGQNHRYIEHPCSFSDCHGVVDDSLAVELLVPNSIWPDGRSVPRRNCPESRVPSHSVLDDCRLMIVEPYDFSSPFNSRKRHFIPSALSNENQIEVRQLNGQR